MRGIRRRGMWGAVAMGVLVMASGRAGAQVVEEGAGEVERAGDEQGVERLVERLIAHGVVSKEEMDAAWKLIPEEASRESASARMKLAMAIMQRGRGDLAMARRVAEEVTREAPEDADGWRWLGKITEEAGGEAGWASVFEEVESAYLRSVELDASGARVRHLLVWLYYGPAHAWGERIGRARVHAEALVRMAGQEHSGHFFLAMMESEDGTWEREKREFELAAECAGSRRELSACLLAKASAMIMDHEESREALGVLDEVMEVYPEDATKVHYLRGMAYRNLERFLEAAGEFEAVVAEEPDANNARLHAADCYRRGGNREKAAEVYREFARWSADEEEVARAMRWVEEQGVR